MLPDGSVPPASWKMDAGIIWQIILRGAIYQFIDGAFQRRPGSELAESIAEI